MDARAKRWCWAWWMLAWAVLVVGVLIVYHLTTPLPPLPPGPVGLWQLDETRGKGNASVEAFCFDGQTVTLYLFPLTDFNARPQDDYYRVQAQWQGRDLYIRDPRYWVGWVRLASFVDGRFMDRRLNGSVLFIYKKVHPAELKKRHRILLEDRPVWDYSTSVVDW